MIWVSRQGGYLAYSLQGLVADIHTALQAEAGQLLQPHQLPHPFAGHLHP